MGRSARASRRSGGDPEQAAERRQSEPEILGEIIHNARRGRFSLAELSLKAGVSIGLLSQIERGLGNPSFVTLSKIVRALDLPIGALFQGDATQPRGKVVRPDKRLRLALPHEGLDWEVLTPDLSGSIALIRCLIPPHFDNRVTPSAHVGEECLHIAEGNLDVFLGDDLYELCEGDSITFDSAVPHSVRNRGPRRVALIGASSPPSYRSAQSRSH